MWKTVTISFNHLKNIPLNAKLILLNVSIPIIVYTCPLSDSSITKIDFAHVCSIAITRPIPSFKCLFAIIQEVFLCIQKLVELHSTSERETRCNIQLEQHRQTKRT